MTKFLKLSRWKRFFLFLDKRQRFALQAIVLTVGLLITQLISEDYRFFVVILLVVASYFFSAWSLTHDIVGVEWLLLFILPVSFSSALSLFYFLLPARWIVRLTLLTVFAIGTYAILLVENIYNVASERSIQLLRVAQSVGLLLTLVVVFLSAGIIYSLRITFFLNFLVFIPLIFILSLQSLWSIRLETKVSRTLILYSGLVSLGVGEVALALSFWPLSNTAYSLFATASFYSLVSIIQHHFSGRLFKDAIREYIIVLVFTFILILFVAKWRG